MEENLYYNREYLLRDRTYGSNTFQSVLGRLLGSTNVPPQDKTIGTDVSKWNGESDFAKMYSKGMRFGVAKGTDVGWGTKKPFIDEKADYNYTEMRKAKMLTGFYCWLDPNAYSSPIEQANFFVDLYKKYDVDIPPVLDFEDRDVISWDNMLWRAQTWLKIVEEKTGRKPIVYTSPGYMAAFNKSKTDFLKGYPLWVAHYIQRTYPTIPYPWDEYLIWQYSDRGHYPYYVWNSGTMHGREWGSGSSYLDMNWWNGTYAEMLIFCKGETPQPIPPVIEPVHLFEAQCITAVLNIRRGPSILNPIVGSLKMGMVVKVYKVENGWYKISPSTEQWVSGSPLYMKKIDEPEEPQEPEEPIGPSEPLKELYYPCDERWYISQYFGERPHIYTQSKGHNGVDWAVPVGNPIYCAADGIVEVSTQQTTGYGRHIRIRHSHGVTIYGHMSRNDVRVGDRVKAKQIIGLSGGATTDPYGGYTTGPHLHFEYRWDITAPQVPGGYTYNAVDPFPLLKSHEDTEAMFQIKVKVIALYVRSGPGVGFPALHTIRKDQIHSVYEVQNGWFRIGIGRWCSGNEAFVEKIGDTGEPSEPEPEPSNPALFRAKCVVTALNVRSSAGIEGKILWQLKNGDIVNVYELKNGWYRIHETEQQWCSGNSSYMIKI